MKHALHVQRLQVHTSTRNSQVALQLALQQAMKRIVISEAHLPTSAILVIRHHKVETMLSGSAMATRQWAADLSSQILKHINTAQRPALQSISHSANSVLFMDYAEMLLCYTRDVLGGQSRWYWQSLFDGHVGFAASNPFISVWTQHPEAIPVLMTRLASREVQHILNQFTPLETALLIEAIHNHFDIPPLESEIAALQPAPFVPEDRFHPGPALTDLPAPWRQWLPAQDTTILSPQAVYLWGLAMTIARQPQLARSGQFVESASRWLRAALAPASISGKGHTDAEIISIVSPEHAPSVNTPSPETIEESPETALASAPGGIRTQLGGIFYLINLLNWILSVSEPSIVHSMNRWELVGALAAYLLADEDRSYAHDPIWDVIRELANLPDSEAWGQHLNHVPRFALRAEAMVGWGVGHLRYVIQQDEARVRIEAPDLRLVILDMHSDAFDQHDVMASYQRVRLSLHNTPGASDTIPRRQWSSGAIHPALGYWLDCVGPLCDFRLHLHHPDSPASMATLLRVPATIQITFTHIDVRMNLEHISMDIRRSGLDQNPGWAPDYGHVITFYFQG